MPTKAQVNKFLTDTAPNKANEITLGVDLNSMTSRSLIEFGKVLKTDIENLHKVENSGEITKEQKEELKERINTQKIVTHSLARLSKFTSALQKAGFDISKYETLSELSINSMAEKADKYADSLQGVDDSKSKKIRKIAEKYRNSTTTIMGTSKLGAVLQGGLKLNGMVLLTASAGMTLNAAVTAIGSIPLAGSEAATVAAWVAKNMPFLKPAMFMAFFGAVSLIAAKKLGEFSNKKNMAIAGAATHQLAADDKLKKEAKEVTVKTLADEVATNPTKMNKLKEILNGKNADEIIAAGPTSKKFTAEEWQAARVLKQIEVDSQPLRKESILVTAERDVTTKQTSVKNAEKAFNEALAEKDALPKPLPDEVIKNLEDKVTESTNNLTSLEQEQLNIFNRLPESKNAIEKLLKDYGYKNIKSVKEPDLRAKLTDLQRDIADMTKQQNGLTLKINSAKKAVQQAEEELRKAKERNENYRLADEKVTEKKNKKDAADKALEIAKNKLAELQGKGEEKQA